MAASSAFALSNQLNQSSVSLNDTIKEFDIKARRVAGSHDKQPVTCKNLLDYMAD